jgi:DNA-binding NarL/FixJ family response regulator
MDRTIRVAVCDDARAVKVFLRHILEEEGDIEVVSSTSTGRAALEEVSELQPHVLLLDLLLPDVEDPAVLVGQLRERSPSAAILLISNMPPTRLEEEAARLRTDGWLLKAQKPEELRDAVRAVVATTG